MTTNPPVASMNEYRRWVEAFAEQWASGNHEAALVCANNAEEEWRARFLDQQVATAETWHFPWPLPGCPEADEAVGWKGWELV